jgi:hypothetical protein
MVIQLEDILNIFNQRQGLTLKLHNQQKLKLKKAKMMCNNGNLLLELLQGQPLRLA